MFGDGINSSQKPRFGVKSLSAVAFAFFLVGLIVASGMNWTKALLAASPASSAPVISGQDQDVFTSPFTSLARELTPTVVNIKINKVEKTGSPWSNLPQGPFREFFRQPPLPESRPVQGAGSGVIIGSDGLILTNNHVVEGAREVTVTLVDKKEYQAEVIGRDPKTDLAVLKVNPDSPLIAATLGDSEQLQVGDWVLAVGNPFGLGNTVTSGIVSAKGRVIGAGPYDDFIQTDASINPGNSGGPLFNVKGEVVGINSAIISSGQGIGFAIPVNTARPLIPQLVEKGRVTRGYLGVNIQTVTPDLAAALGLADSKGVLVADVVPGGAADKAGIERGDVIVAYEGKRVEDSHALPALVAASPVGKEVTITLVRSGKEHAVTARIAAMAAEELAANDSDRPTQGKWGLKLQDITPDLARQLRLKADEGALVASVQEGSPAHEAGVRQGDVILEVNRESVKSVNDVKERVARADDRETLLLLIQREQGSQYVVLKG